MKTALTELKQWLAETLQQHLNEIKWSTIVVNIAALVALAFWISNKQTEVFGARFDHELIFVSLIILLVILNQLYRFLLKESEYSPAYALATGYVTNFLVPSITQLAESGESCPVIYIYKVEKITALDEDNIDQIQAAICNGKFEAKQVSLKAENARARDLLMIQKSKTSKIYLDFPNTLTSLKAYIDFKFGSKQDKSTEAKKEQLTEILIGKFYQKVNELVARYDITDNIKFCDKRLDFTFR
jgi:hypothetical protein